MALPSPQNRRRLPGAQPAPVPGPAVQPPSPGRQPIKGGPVMQGGKHLDSLVGGPPQKGTTLSRGNDPLAAALDRKKRR